MSGLWCPGDGVEAALEVIDGPAELAEDLVPTVDQDSPVATYCDWRKEDTRIVTYRVANDVYPGIRADSREAAVRACVETFGPILEANYVPGRAFFRVFRQLRNA